MSARVLLVLSLGLCAAADPVSVQFHPCHGDNATLSDACAVHEVRIDPCPEAPRPCHVQRGSEAAISFDFTPNFEASAVQTAVYWANGAAEPQLPGMDTDGCHFSSCPFRAGERNQFNFKLYLGKKLPKGQYPIKWKVWNRENQEQVCCYITRIELTGKRKAARGAAGQ